MKNVSLLRELKLLFCQKRIRFENEKCRKGKIWLLISSEIWQKPKYLWEYIGYLIGKNINHKWNKLCLADSSKWVNILIDILQLL